MTAEVLLGTQGWGYPAWVGPFYPHGTKQAGMLQIYSRAFRTVEVDSTFYGTPPEAVVREWRERVPQDFVFALKIPQEITHTRQLTDVQELLNQFLERARLLGDTLGPLLVQLSPAFRATDEHESILAEFIGQLPAEFRWAVEFRDPRWVTTAMLERLRSHNIALALVDGRWIRRRTVLDLIRQPTADFAYIRWMGPTRSIIDYSRVQVDRDRELAQWGDAIRALAERVRTVYGYFNNHFQGHSPQSARSLQRAVGQTPMDPKALRQQVELFS